MIMITWIGVNAITGGQRDKAPPKGIQDYVIGGKQPWLDGIATEPGVVCQVSFFGFICLVHFITLGIDSSYQ